MFKTIFIASLSLILIFLFSNWLIHSFAEPTQNALENTHETFEKMIVANGSVRLDLDLSQLNRAGQKQAKSTVLNFDAEPDSFFTIIVHNGELRAVMPSSMSLIAQNAVNLPAKLSASSQQLIIENTGSRESFELVVRDGKTGFVFFNIEGHEFDYNPDEQLFKVQSGRLLISAEFARELGRPAAVGLVAGEISIRAKMRQIEIAKVVDGEVVADILPALKTSAAGGVPGPDVIVGDVYGLAQFGNSSGTQVGLAVGTDSCNAGTVDLNWFSLPNNDHPVIPQNLYRMSGGASNTERFEQIGQSHVKHAFTALTQNLCGFGCNGVGGSKLGSGCSDPYSASLNAGPNLGSRAWINPFNGAYPRGDSATPPNNHAGHAHNGTSHRILTEISDLNSALNQGAAYFAESQYVTPHEYVWCQANPAQCNMYNNVSYRKYLVLGTTSPFSFAPAAATVRSQPALSAWTGATLVEIKPDAGNDGVGAVAYKVTNPSPGVWHYEYAVYNQNLDRAIQSFSVPIGNGVTLTNVGFHAPPQHPAWTADGTVGSAGFSNAAWTNTQTGAAMTWSSETFAQNPNANAIRWGTMYNFRFDSNRPPQTANATVGFLKTGAPVTVQIQSPTPTAVPSAVSISGRVTSTGNRGLANAVVSIADSNGIVRRTATTNTFGYYRFDSIQTGAAYTIAVAAKRYTFAARTVQVNDNLVNMDFSPTP